ncbi:hypothetical protein N7489_005178 [Penicillium chrysogenum]|uniref:Uncharacterized protein n=1 Tax=Penicillium chrysogenum TaxID=5076 RepID=A0ABQ8WQY6_PENCH|nr:uncharacterized protein N7489_005178 [Penicillium chrysogenum]KAJ5245082.1 hypothetical protein N7489_005178 [Penicillium chrysogenum]KAJ5274818.1 hypothetical protein N7505_003363 [Penicillium chrysogenum]
MKDAEGSTREKLENQAIALRSHITHLQELCSAIAAPVDEGGPKNGGAKPANLVRTAPSRWNMDGACKVAWYQVGVFAYEEEAPKKRQRRQIWHSLEPHLLGGMVPGLFFFRATRDTLNQ